MPAVPVIFSLKPFFLSHLATLVPQTSTNLFIILCDKATQSSA